MTTCQLAEKVGQCVQVINTTIENDMRCWVDTNFTMETRFSGVPAGWYLTDDGIEVLGFAAKPTAPKAALVTLDAVEPEAAADAPKTIETAPTGETLADKVIRMCDRDHVTVTQEAFDSVVEDLRLSPDEIATTAREVSEIIGCTIHAEENPT